MAEYIEREAAKKEFNLNFGSVSHAVVANRILDALPAADVAPVVHGRWITDEKDVTYCGRCRIIDDYASVHKYCPNCGAKMDLE